MGSTLLLGEYDLSSREGVVLMCLAEALLRIPDAATADKLIARQARGRPTGERTRRKRLAVRQRVDVGLLLTGRVSARRRRREDTGTFLDALVERARRAGRARRAAPGDEDPRARSS